MTQFNVEMDKNYSELEKKFSDMKEKMISLQKKEIEDKIYDFNKHFPHIPKPSSNILNYQKILKGLVKQKQYEKANIIKLLVNEEIKNEKQKWNALRDKKVKNEIDSTKAKHESELTNFEVKLRKSINSFTKNRNTENEKINLKYNNKLKDLESNHKIESRDFKNINTYHAKLLSGELTSKINIISRGS